MKYKAVVSYSGEAYCGFQRQPKGKTIQGELEKQLTFLAGESIQIKGAGRTDAGVHALGQTFSFPCHLIEDIPAFLTALNRLLPEDIYVRSLEQVDDGFDARHSSIGKIYEYVFTVNQRDPLRTRKIAQLRRDDFDFDLFLRAFSLFNGTHNFQNFTTKPEDKDGFIRCVEILFLRQEEEGNLVRLRVKGDGFMRYQIRFMVGACIRAATGKLSLKEIEDALTDGPRSILPYKAPPEGLCLMEVLYGGQP
ncbi:MAG: tRNA pseudouridine(38-40) synthase TruA [Bacilli bacterium]|nr:tRNA pseudouridine(38-40) synthase TruA [Bacilli bacterium]